MPEVKDGWKYSRSDAMFTVNSNSKDNEKEPRMGGRGRNGNQKKDCVP